MPDNLIPPVTNLTTIENTKNSNENINVKTWFDFCTDPGTITLIVVSLLLVPFFLMLIVTPDKAQHIVDMYATFAVTGIGTATGHAVTDWAKTKTINSGS